MNVGKIEGGTEINSVPDFCKVLVDFRTIDKEAERKIYEKIENLREKYNAEVKEINKISAFLNEFDGFTKTSNFITEASFLENKRILTSDKTHTFLVGS